MTGLPLFAKSTSRISRSKPGDTPSRVAEHGAQDRGSGRLRQRGAMAIPMLLLLLTLISMLGLIEVGNFYWARRDTQKVADLAALAGAQQLSDCAASNASNTAAYGNATVENGFTGTGKTLTITCGNWDPVANTGPEYFAPVVKGGAPNAVMVTAGRPVASIYGFAGTLPRINTVAIATNLGGATAAFSVGSQLLGVSSTSPLGNLLNSALGTSLGLQLLSYNGIANTQISLLGLKNLLPISAGTVNGVLNAPITVSNFLDAYVELLSQSANSAEIDISFVQQQIAAIEAQIGNIPINLGQILNVNANTTDPNSALNANVSALDILSAVLQAADSKNAIALPAASINVPGVASVNLSMSVIEPPQIGVGGVGTVAHTAQIRLMLGVNVLNNALTGNQSLLEIPLYLEVAPTDATISAITCGVPSAGGGVTNNVTIAVAPGVLNAFLGNLTSTAFTNTSTTWAGLVAGGTPAPLVDVNLLGIPVASLNASANVQVATTPAGNLTFAVNPTVPISSQAGMTQMLSATPPVVLGTLLSSLLGSTTLYTSVSLLGSPGILNLGALLSGLTSLLQPVLTPLFNTLDTALVGPLLTLLGIDIGNANVQLMSVNCHTGVQLVY